MDIFEGKLVLDGNEKVAIINTRFNHIITDHLVEGTRDAFMLHGDKDDTVCCVYVVMPGLTPHVDYVSAEVTRGVANTAFKHSRPVTFGVLTVDSIEQVCSKAGNKGFEAMVGVVELLSLYRTL